MERRITFATELEDARSQHQALVASLHAAVEALTACVDCIYDLIEHVDAIAAAEEFGPQRRRAQVSYGGGVSPLASFDPAGHLTGRLSHASSAAITEASGLSGPQLVSEVTGGARLLGQTDRGPVSASVIPGPDDIAELPGPDRIAPGSSEGPTGGAARAGTLRGVGRPGAPALMAATDLAHRGYSREEIGERLRDRWGEEAGQILRDLMD